MPPDHISGPPPEGASPGRSERSIPRTRGAKTRELHDNQVNVQLTPFVAIPFLGIVLVFRPDAADAALAVTGAAVLGTRRSYLRHRRLRWG